MLPKIPNHIMLLKFPQVANQIMLMKFGGLTKISLSSLERDVDRDYPPSPPFPLMHFCYEEIYMKL